MGNISQKYAMQKVYNFLVQDYTTREVLFQVKYAQDVSISSEYEKLEIKGGSDNEVQFTSFHSPTSKFAAQLPLIDSNLVQVKTGAIKKTGKQLNSFSKTYAVDPVTGSVKIDVVPKDGTLKIYDTNSEDDLFEEITVGTPTSEVNQYEITTDAITFNTEKKGKLVLVVCDYETGVDAEGLQFISGELPGLIRITATTKIEDKAGNTAIQTLIIDKAKPDPTFNFETSAGNASVMPFECEVFGWTNEDGKTQFFRMVTDSDLK